MSNSMRFSFSDTIAGYVIRFDRNEKAFTLRTSDGREFEAFLTPNTYAQIVRNLDEDYIDCTNRMGEMLTSERYLYVYGIFYPQGGAHTFEAKALFFPGSEPGQYRQEESDWWIKQIHSLASCYTRWQFGCPDKPIDYRDYRTILHLAGAKG